MARAADLYRISALEHELLDGPYNHDKCYRCHPESGGYSMLAYSALRPELGAAGG